MTQDVAAIARGKAVEQAAHRIYDACRPDHPLPYHVCERLADAALCQHLVEQEGRA